MKKTTYRCLNTPECGKQFLSSSDEPTCPYCYSENVSEVLSGKAAKAAEKAAPVSMVHAVNQGVGASWVQASQIKRASEYSSDEKYFELGNNYPHLKKMFSEKGIPTGSLTFFYGDAGVGKSTFSVAILDCLIENDYKVLYISSEEKGGSVASRIERISKNAANIDLVNIYSLSDSNMRAEVLGEYDFVVIDSISAFMDKIEDFVTYIRQLANQTGTAFILIGHVIKSGGHKGPETIKHIVDIVWEAYGEFESKTKTIVSVKNRYNKGNAIFYELTDAGVKITSGESDDSYLNQRKETGGQIASTLTVLRRGETYIPIDIQASFVDGNALRAFSSNVSLNKVNMVFSTVCPFIQNRVGNVTVEIYGLSGYKIQSEAEVNLPMAVSIFSAANNLAVPSNIAVLGTMDLSGRIFASADIEAQIERVAPYVDTILGPKLKTSVKQAKYVQVSTFKELAGKLFGGQFKKAAKSSQTEDGSIQKKASTMMDIDNLSFGE